MDKEPITVACCMPKQLYTLDDKLQWLESAIKESGADLFLTPQEYLGGHYIHCQKKMMDLHVQRNWVIHAIGILARKHKVHVGVGACCFNPGSGATEDYIYLDDTGKYLGHHSKFALPSYDDARTGGHGQLWPETNFKRRITPIALPKLRLKVGTMFCWEVFSQSIWPAYSLAGVNLVTHPIKFAPRGWLKNKKLSDGKLHIVGFDQAPKSQIWIDRLIMAGRHQVMCPIAVSCNSWNLGEKYKALVGHVDELRGATELLDVPSIGSHEEIHTFEMLPEWYEGIDYHHSGGAFKAHTGTIDGYSEMGEWTMTGKIRRLEAHLIGGTTLTDCILKTAAAARQKKSSVKRAFGTGLQAIKRERREN